MELNAQYDFAMQGKTAREVISRCPVLPVLDVDELPPRVRQRDKEFLRLVALKTIRG